VAVDKVTSFDLGELSELDAVVGDKCSTEDDSSDDLGTNPET